MRVLGMGRAWLRVAAAVSAAVALIAVPTVLASQAPIDFGRLAMGAHGAVVSVDGHATNVGIEVLQAGGNAIDAAIAVGMTLAVTHPQAGNLGGGGFMVVYLAEEGRYTTLDFREKAPAAATRTMYLDEDGRPVRGLNYVGWKAVGVPGTVAGFGAAHARWGRLPWSRLVEPAVRLASDGFYVSPYLAGSFARVARIFRQHEASAATFLHSNGTPYAAGERFRQPDLAWTLRQIASGGADAFYRGPIAERVAAAMTANGGLITAADLAAYEAIEREPVRGTYRGYEIVSMGPPSSGGTILVQMLNILEQFDLSEMEPTSPELVHLMAESMRQAYLDRALYLGDADHSPVPVERLTSKEYARQLAAEIPRERARASSEVGVSVLTTAESPETTHYSVVDATGNAVSTTYTIEAGFGAKVVAAGTGFLLNNEMGDFNEWPGVTNSRGYVGTEPNLIAPGKRPLSSMTPTIVARDGVPLALIGSPGGKTIINTVLRVVTNLIDFDLALPDAVDSPRVHHQWMPDSLRLESSFPAATIATLEEMGHSLGPARLQGDAHCIYIYPDGARMAVADGRRSGAAAAY